VRIEKAKRGKLRLRYGHHPDLLELQGDGSAKSATVQLRNSEGGGLWMDRPNENQSSQLQPCAGASALHFAGRYHCHELGAELSVLDAGGVLYGGFSGFLGQARMEILEALGPDIWLLPCPRALDHTPPGDWTLSLRRDGGGGVSEIELGCWLARKLIYTRAG
jgi:D-aminopeptidase